MSAIRPLNQEGALPPSDRLDAIVAMTDAEILAAPQALGREMLAIGERSLEAWLIAKDQQPHEGVVEGFRLLALHRQGAKGDPSFNACRETCRELLYNFNCIGHEADPAAIARRVRISAMVARHLLLFIDGKLENAGLGEFCCSSRPLRMSGTENRADQHA
jgi:hypothetical protein